MMRGCKGYRSIEKCCNRHAGVFEIMTSKEMSTIVIIARKYQGGLVYLLIQLTFIFDMKQPRTNGLTLAWMYKPLGMIDNNKMSLFLDWQYSSIWTKWSAPLQPGYIVINMYWYGKILNWPPIGRGVRFWPRGGNTRKRTDSPIVRYPSNDTWVQRVLIYRMKL